MAFSRPLAAIRGVPRETKLVVSLIGVSHFVNHMYLILLPPIFGLLGEEFGVSLAALGIAVGVQGVANMSFQLPFGYLSDNYSRTVTLGTGLFLSAGAVFTIASAPSYEWLLVGQALLGIGIAAHHPAHYPLLSAATEPGQRGRVFSIHGFAGNIGYAAAPALIVGVLAFPGTTWRDALYLIGAIGLTFALFCTLVLAWRVNNDVTIPNGVKGDVELPTPGLSIVGQTVERVQREARSLAGAPGILALTLLAGVTSMSGWGVRSYAVVLLTDGYALDLQTANAALTAMFVVSAVFILVSGELTDRVSAGRVIIGSFIVLFIAALGVASFLVPPLLAVILIIATESAISFSGPARSKWTDALSTRNSLGMNFALITVGVTMAGSIAPPLFGLVIDTEGFGWAFFVIALFAALAALLSVFILRRFDE